MTDNRVRASDRRCVECGKPAVAFWPVIDPDIPAHPYCRRCLDKAKAQLLAEMFKTDRKKRDNSDNTNNSRQHG